MPDLQGVGPDAGEGARAGGREVVLIGRHLLRQAQDLSFHGRNLVVENLADSFGPKHGGSSHKGDGENSEQYMFMQELVTQKERPPLHIVPVRWRSCELSPADCPNGARRGIHRRGIHRRRGSRHRHDSRRRRE